MLNVINLNETVMREHRIRRADIAPVASLPGKNKVLYRVATSEDGGTNYVVIGDLDGPPKGSCLMFSLEGMLGINPNLNVERLG